MRLSSDQIELRDTLRAFLEEKVSSEYLRSRIENGTRHDSAFEADLSALGLDEGFSGEAPLFSSTELGVIAHEAGRALLPEPAIERLLALRVLPSVASEAGKMVLKDAFAGSPKLLVALKGSSDVSFDPATGKAYGSVAWAYGDDAPRLLLCFGSIPGEGQALLIVNLSVNAAVTACTSLDLTQSLTAVSLNGATALSLSKADCELFDAYCSAMKACELAGVCERVIEMTVAYVKTREQFGVPVGGFQAVQQKLADAFASSQALGALSRFAAWAATNSPEQRPLTAQSAALYGAKVAPAICETAIQCHGGIGFTWEYDLHLYLRRAKLIESGLAGSSFGYGALLEAVK